MQHACDMRNS